MATYACRPILLTRFSNSSAIYAIALPPMTSSAPYTFRRILTPMAPRHIKSYRIAIADVRAEVAQQQFVCLALAMYSLLFAEAYYTGHQIQE
ncbi:hypothetical protein SAMN05216387_10785 [Nitrosovibrio tenuis]|uniref:Uncharacterized protein n=1 Tax=Nitrosovibrio tenuis TaxID=1233 RepID=A0A1H7NPC9_9PROT|nr:hypothetical protein SAMN05216387_10785 [Nitrosovibrio tenuis]